MKLFLLLSASLALSCSLLHAKTAEPVANLAQARDQAAKENKLLFVAYGREKCGNCQALKELIKEKKVKLDSDDYVYADVNCDDALQQKLFSSNYQVKGTTLPFVVIAAPDGTVLASRTGYGSESDYDDLFKTAKKALKAKAGT
jgi:hypothetical protein